MVDATLVVLAGGRGSRMGTPKSELRIGDVTLVEWIVRRLAPSFDELLVCGAAVAPAPARALRDARPDAGPLAGIETGLAAASSDAVFVLACDTPRASADVAALLVARSAGHDAAVPRVAGRTQPTCAAYRKSALAPLRAYLDSGARRVTEAVNTLDAVFIDEEELSRAGIDTREFTDLDTREDYDAFVASIAPR